MVGGSIVFDVIGNTDKIKSQIQQVGKDAMTIGDSGEKAGISLGKKILSGLKTIVTVAAIKKFVGDVIEEGAKLEQAIGGAETLFDDHATKVIENANKAWQTAGVSANQYLEGVNSFAASLLQSTNQNTELAADIADMAFKDMSDNANKFGSDMQSIQNAYQGFAKQNYTMLDNLKLGYGGTKTEMERLLKDAEKLSGVKYDISSLKDVYSAIHVIQEEMGVTGTTLKEATETYSGSLNSMVAAWKNFQSSLALGENVGQSIEALLSSAGHYLKNLTRMLLNVVKELPSAIYSLLKSSVSYLKDVGFEYISNLSEGFVDGIPSLIDKGLEIIDGIIANLKTLLPQLLNVGMDIVINLTKGIMKSLPSLIKSIPSIIHNIADTIRGLFSVIRTRGMELLKEFVSGIFKALPTLLSSIGDIVAAMWDLFWAVNWLDLGSQIIIMLWDGIKEVAPKIWEFLKETGQKAWDAFKNIDWLGLGKKIITFIVNGITSLASNIGSKIKEAGTNAVNKIKEIKWLDLGKDIITNIVNGIVNVAGNIGSALKNAAINAFNIFKGVSWWDLGKNIIDGIKGGINSGASSLNNTISKVVTNAKGTATHTLMINSPSKVFENDVGKWIPLGIAKGIEDEASSVNKSIDKMLEDTTDAIVGAKFPSIINDLGEINLPSAEEGTNYNYGGIVINFNVPENMDGRQLFNEFETELARITTRRRMVYQ